MARKRGPLSAAHKAAISASLRGRAANSISASMKKRSSATVSLASAGGFRGAKGRVYRPSKVQANRRGRRAASLAASGRSTQRKLNPRRNVHGQLATLNKFSGPAQFQTPGGRATRSLITRNLKRRAVIQ